MCRSFFVQSVTPQGGCAIRHRSTDPSGGDDMLLCPANDGFSFQKIGLQENWLSV
jgi:hypothetical protein